LLSFPDGNYSFRLTRGPEYRVIRGNFELERESFDDHHVALPRMVDMIKDGWVSGDACVLPSPNSLPLRMASEDLHVAAVIGHQDAKPIPSRDRDEDIDHSPTWIRDDVVYDHGLLYYGLQELGEPAETSPIALSRLADLPRDNDEVRVAIETPFAWPLPVWIASERVDGIFLLGDWLQPGRTRISVKDGRNPDEPRIKDPAELGRFATQIYFNLLEAGIRLAPLAGSGNEGKATAVGYNRIYVNNEDDRYTYQVSDGNEPASKIESADEWWNAAWKGKSVVTNGPMLKPRLEGKIPGHTFEARSGDSVRLQPELQLSTRDPVDYLDVVCNNQIHYSARLDEFAKAGGKIPSLELTESSWVVYRVVTLYEDHYRAALSAPWFIEFDEKPRKTSQAAQYFRDWLSQYEAILMELPPEELAKHVPYIRAARNFWDARVFNKE